MRSIGATFRPGRGRPAAGGQARVTLLLRAADGSGALLARPRRIPDRALARLFGASLDHQLASGRAPESGRLLAVRAQHIVSLTRRRALARNWERLLVRAGRPGRPGQAGALLARDRITGAEPDLRDLIAGLLSPLPVAARGVATARVLLTDAAGPLYNRRSPTALPAAARTAVSQLDPAVPLHEPAAA